MSGKRIGYIRVSSTTQNIARQEEQLESLKLDRVFVDKASGKNLDRPALTQMLSYIRDADEIYVTSLDRLGRDCNDLQNLVRTITDAGATVHFIKEALTFNGDDSSLSRLLLNVMSAFSQFERELIKERQQQGIEIAKANGVYKGRAKALKPEQVMDMKSKVADGIPKAKIAREMGISRKSLYNYLEQ
jgi:DNA invertase Pin-like site-specific DNA recombinase